MPLVTQAWHGAGVLDQYPQAGPALPALPANAGAGVSSAIGQLQVNQVFGGPGATNVQNVSGWRIDRQNAPANYANISVQRNGVGAPSTVASVFVPTALNIAPGPGGPAAQPFAARISELIRAVRRGLEQSFATHHVVVVAGAATARITRMEVTGNFSA